MAVIQDKSLAERPLLRFRDGALDAELTDTIAVEEPLEIRVAGEPVAVTMRTPGDDHRLALGFLYSEGIVTSPDDVGTVSHCGRPGEEGYGNVIDVTPAAGADLQVEKVQASRRGTLTTSACGVCGRRTVDDLFAQVGPVPPTEPVPLAVVAASTSRLRDVQRVFAKTGGTHAAAALDQRGEIIAGFEDVGRHNAVDKVIGSMVLRGLSSQRGARRAQGPEGEPPAILAVSGRASFEIVQKAAMARIPIVASVSAASSLAIDLADRVGVALVTFVRDGSLNVCTHPERIAR